MVNPERQVDAATGQVTYRWNGGEGIDLIQGYGFTPGDAISDYWVNVHREAALGRERESVQGVLTGRQMHALTLAEPEIVRAALRPAAEPAPAVVIPEPEPKVGFFRRLFRRKH